MNKTAARCEFSRRSGIKFPIKHNGGFNNIFYCHTKDENLLFNSFMTHGCLKVWNICPIAHLQKFGNFWIEQSSNTNYLIDSHEGVRQILSRNASWSNHSSVKSWQSPFLFTGMFNNAGLLSLEPKTPIMAASALALTSFWQSTMLKILGFIRVI